MAFDDRASCAVSSFATIVGSLLTDDADFGAATFADDAERAVRAEQFTGCGIAVHAVLIAGVEVTQELVHRRRTRRGSQPLRLVCRSLGVGFFGHIFYWFKFPLVMPQRWLHFVVRPTSMRSVFTFSSVSRDEVRTFLGLELPATGVPVLGIPHIISVDFYDDWPVDMPELSELITQRLGAPPLGVVADISGRVDGSAEATEFCCRFLLRFGGVAMDDYSDHLWTLQELETQTLYRGHHFFDTSGWYRDRAATCDASTQI